MPKRTTKVKDKWRGKTWLKVIAPASFGNTAVTTLPVTEVANATSRVIETTLYDLLKDDPNYYNIKLYFKIDRVEGENGYTIFKGHEYSREFMRSLIRKGSSMVNFISDYKSRDGYVLRVYVTAFTEGRVNYSKKSAMRAVVDGILKERAAALPYDHLVQEIVLNKVASEVFAQAKKVSALRHLGIRKTKLISSPKVREKEVEELATPA
ncbi:MAG: 30S ribosomal protein S3ae [Nitrososphaerota archaeon]|nr:30S ribosomal protein S3ae [Nitrososphaerota archaeon]